MQIQIWHWIVFNAAVIVLLLLDLLVLHRKDSKPSMKSALGWSAFWIGLSLAFNFLIYKWLGQEPAVEFLTAYVLEKSLSVDNLFVFILIFQAFRVEEKYQHRVLFYGILGALILRALFIFLGVELLHHFKFMLYVLGGFLVLGGVRMLLPDKQEYNPRESWVMKLITRFLPVLRSYKGKSFFVRRQGKLFATPMLVVLIMVEFTDLIFALDSIPAVIGISQHPFIIYTSNIMAILGLRALYFALAGIMGLFHYLKYGLAAVLIFIGAKLLLSHWLHLPTWVALTVVGGLLTLSVAASLIFPAGRPKLQVPNSPPEDFYESEEEE